MWASRRSSQTSWLATHARTHAPRCSPPHGQGRCRRGRTSARPAPAQPLSALRAARRRPVALDLRAGGAHARTHARTENSLRPSACSARAHGSRRSHQTKMKPSVPCTARDAVPGRLNTFNIAAPPNHTPGEGDRELSRAGAGAGGEGSFFLVTAIVHDAWRELCCCGG